MSLNQIEPLDLLEMSHWFKEEAPQYVFVQRVCEKTVEEKAS